MIGNPNRVHDKSAGDVRDPISPCPARQDELYVVPTRYALAEEAASHPGFQPTANASSHPMALRRLRSGFLYAWTGEGPLKRYAVAADGLLLKQALTDDDTLPMNGTQAGLRLDKRKDAWLLFSEIPLGPQSREQLAKPKARQKHMRRIAMQDIATNLQAMHCPPLDKADSLIAELMPEVRDLALAQEYHQDSETFKHAVKVLGDRMMKSPTPDNVQAYLQAMDWLNARQSAAGRYPDANQPAPGRWSTVAWDVPATSIWLDKARQQAGELFPVFVALDDDLGVLRDINHEQEQVEAEHENWVADNNLRQSIGTFIRGLISEDAGELASQLNYRYRDREIPITPEQAEQLLKAQPKLKELLKEETTVNVQQRHTIGHAAADAHIADIARRREEILAPIRCFVPADLQAEVQSVVHAYRKDKASQLEGGRASAKVAEYIDLERMNDWLDQQAPAHYQAVEARHTFLYTDRKTFLARHGEGTWFVEYDNPEHQRWLDELAFACLSAQCHRRQGVEQFTSYLNGKTEGALRLLFLGWSPSLEAAVNSSSRLGELQSALSLDNLAATRSALLGVLDEPAVRALERLAKEVNGYWSDTVARLGAVLLALKAKGRLAGQWLGTLLVARLGEEAYLVRTLKDGKIFWSLLGAQAEKLDQWVRATASAIGQGRAGRILNSPIVRSSGGLLPLAALLVNALNAESYLAQANALEHIDAQRKQETLSATLYAGAALVAVVQNWLIVGKGIQELAVSRGQFSFVAPTLTLFGGFVGALSLMAATNEFQVVSQQVETAQSSVDPWLEVRRLAISGQMAAYAAQAAIGFSLTGMRLANRIDTATALRRFRLSMGPINLLLLALGTVYLLTWWRQQTPLQSYLAGCCWSKARARNTGPIPAEQQKAEFDHLLTLLYQPRIIIDTREQQRPGSAGDTVSIEGIYRLSIDLPGAEPATARLGLGLIGNAVPERFRIFRSNTVPSQDLGGTWLAGCHCQWIPAEEGQGLRLSGNLYPAQERISLRLRYHNPVAELAGIDTIGGGKGIAYVQTAESSLITLRPGEATPELDRAQVYLLTGEGRLNPGEAK